MVRGVKEARRYSGFLTGLWSSPSVCSLAFVRVLTGGPSPVLLLDPRFIFGTRGREGGGLEFIKEA